MPDAPPSADPPRRGPYVLLRMHAEGGLGRISLAKDPRLPRQVAVKEVRPDLRGNLDHLARFLTEAEITGQLEHPGVVPVYALAEENGQPYYVMRFIQGRPLQVAIQQYHRKPSPLAFRELLQRFVSVCQTVAYAHSRGIIHRDLKPDNVMVGDFGETLVLDWGLAKHLEPPGRPAQAPPPPRPSGVVKGLQTLTHEGEVLGTPSYMAPEQAQARNDEVGPAADVFALGAMLYEILTGRPPYRGEDPLAVFEQARDCTFQPPRHLNPAAPPALEAVCLKAMARKPADRYAGAAELARDLERWLGDEPVTAWREPWTVRLLRWRRRHRTLAAGVVVALGLAVVFLGVLVWYRDRVHASRQANSAYLLSRLAGLTDRPAIDAEPLLRECLDLSREVLPPGHWLTADVKSRLGGFLADHGRDAEAGPLLQEGLAGLEAAPDAPPERVGQARARLQRWAARQGD